MRRQRPHALTRNPETTWSTSPSPTRSPPHSQMKTPSTPSGIHKGMARQDFLTDRTPTPRPLAVGGDGAATRGETATLATRAQAADDGDCEELYLDLLDCLDGWCSPHMKL